MKDKASPKGEYRLITALAKHAGYVESQSETTLKADSEQKAAIVEKPEPSKKKSKVSA